MLAIKFNAENAEKLAATLAPISPKAETSAYLIGVIREAKRLVQEVMASEGLGVSLLNEVIEQLDGAKANVSAILANDIARG